MSEVNQRMNRRSAIKGLGAFGAVTMAAACGSDPTGPDVDRDRLPDADVANFALNFEYLETEYYLRGTAGAGLDQLFPEERGTNPGPVSAPWTDTRVSFSNEAFRMFAEELAANELAHVRYYRNVLGANAISRPAIDLGAFAAVAEAAGLGSGFNPFANEINFFLGGMALEDVGITAYKGAANHIDDRDLLEDIAGVLATEAHHMGMVRSLLYRAGPEARQAANAISALRDQLDGTGERDQGIEIQGRANVVPADERGITFSRTPQQALRIVYAAPQPGVTRGGFFPQGVNGAIRST